MWNHTNGREKENLYNFWLCVIYAWHKIDRLIDAPGYDKDAVNVLSEKDKVYSKKKWSLWIFQMKQEMIKILR